MTNTETLITRRDRLKQCLRRCAAIAMASVALSNGMAQQSEETDAKFQAALDAMPTSTTKEAADTFGSLLRKPKPAVAFFCSKLNPERDLTDVRARYALAGMVWESGRAASRNSRPELASALADCVAKANGAEAKDFVLEQIQYAGSADVGSRLFAFLDDPSLRWRALKTIAALKTPGLGKELVKRLANSDAKWQAAALAAVLRTNELPRPAEIEALAASDDATVARAALDLLAEIGSPDSEAALRKGLEDSDPVRQSQAITRFVRYAQRVADGGKKSKAEELLRSLPTGPLEGSPSVAAASLHGLCRLLGTKANVDLIKAMESPDIQVRGAALNLAEKMQGNIITKSWITELDKQPTQQKSEILAMLGRRADPAALPAILAACEAKETTVTATAIRAAGRLGKFKAAPTLLKVLSNPDATLKEAATDELARMSGDAVLRLTSEAMPAAAPDARAAMMDILSRRRAVQFRQPIVKALAESDKAQRTAALKALENLAQPEDVPQIFDATLNAASDSDRSLAQKALVTAAKREADESRRRALIVGRYVQLSADQRPAIAGALAELGGDEALRAIVEDAKGGEQKVQDAAARALSEWTDLAAAEELLAMANDTSAPLKRKVMALRGYLRLANTQQSDQAEKLKMLRAAVKSTDRPEELKTAISILAAIKTEKSLLELAALMDNKDVAQEAADAAVGIAVPERRRGRGMHGADVANALEKALAILPAGDKRKKTEDQINQLQLEAQTKKLPDSSEAGFLSLFNGKDLTGWIGAVGGYKVEGGAIVCDAKSGGNLYTDKDFADFHLKFEFRVPPGGNNGVGIRAPLSGDSAYNGMEIQVLDNDSEKYKDIKPWQVHGSVYGVAPAKRATIKTGDDWNSEEIIAEGTRIKVIVNGETLTDVDLAEVEKTGTADGKDHPGMKRSSGHIGFLGHGSAVAFRNLRIKTLANQTPDGFTALYNGKDLEGWKGLVADPIKRKAMNAAELKAAQDKADQEMRDHWSIHDGILVFDGDGSHLCTTKDYKNVEMLVDWKIGPGGDSGIYLRGSPQVQIWDPRQWPQGSGGLYNNQKNTSNPLEVADNPIGTWNRFRIIMAGEKVTVFLNGKKVVDDVTLENYWDRKQPIFPIEQLELQSHGSPSYWKNVYVKELPDSITMAEALGEAKPAAAEAPKSDSDSSSSAESQTESAASDAKETTASN